MSGDWRQKPLLPGVTQRVFLVRHGETDKLAKGRCYGKLDVPLSELGVQQMAQSAQLLAPLGPTRIISSPRIRALDSANTIATACALNVSVNEQFAELHFGDFEGLRYEEVEAKYPEFYSNWMTHPTEVTFPNGESYNSMSERVVSGFEHLITSGLGEKTVLVAHGGVIRIILAQILALDPKYVFRLDQSYSAISCLDFYGDTPLLRVMNWLP